MTFYLNFRSQSVGGTVIDPYVLSGDGIATSPTLQTLSSARVASLVAGKNVLFAAHGFNVSYRRGVLALGQLEPHLGLTANDVYFGLLWPGDYWIPVVNYPFEGDVAIDCGKRLADFCSRWFGTAQSLSFISHSLGARLVLEAIKGLERKVSTVCLAAAAINQDALLTEYSVATANAGAISLLASHSDLVLKYAFQIGDPIADVLRDDHQLFEPALGYDGPPLPAGPPITSPWQIPEGENYRHGDYLPPGDSIQDAGMIAASKWLRAADFMARAFRQQRQIWP